MFCLHLVNFNTFLIERFIRCTHLGIGEKMRACGTNETGKITEGSGKKEFNFKKLIN